MRRWAVEVFRRLWREMVGFSMVGIVGVTCDITTFNLVIGVLHAPKVYGSVSGTALGTHVGYLGNKYWVFPETHEQLDALRDEAPPRPEDEEPDAAALVNSPC